MNEQSNSRSDVVLDSSALLGFLFDESVAGEVEEILSEALNSRQKVLVTAVNWAEVLCRVIEARGNEGLSIVQHVERTSPIEIIPADGEMAEVAGTLSTQYHVPLADAFAAALAKRLQAILVTGDRDFAALAKEIQVRWLHPSKGIEKVPDQSEQQDPSSPQTADSPEDQSSDDTGQSTVVGISGSNRYPERQSHARRRRDRRHGTHESDRRGRRGQSGRPGRNKRRHGQKEQSRGKHPNNTFNSALLIAPPRRRKGIPEGGSRPQHFQHTARHSSTQNWSPDLYLGNFQHPQRIGNSSGGGSQRKRKKNRIRGRNRKPD